MVSNRPSFSTRSDRAALAGDWDLGNEPPINPARREQKRPQRANEERRSHSWRWLSGAVLTGLFGASLIGAALYLAIEKAAVTVEAPILQGQIARADLPSDRVGTLRKGDKLVRPTEVIGARQAYRAPMTLRIGDREVIKERSLVRVATSLSTIPGRFASQVPAFNALKLMTEGTNAEQFAEPSAEAGDADVSIVKSDLAELDLSTNGGRTLAPDDVAAQIDEQRRQLRESERTPIIPISSQLLLARTLRAPLQAAALGYAPTEEPTPLLNLDVRVVPENVSVVAKFDAEAQAQLPVEKTYLAKRGDLLDRVLKGLGARATEADQAVEALSGSRAGFMLTEGRVIRVLFGAASGRLAGNILRVVIVNEDKTEAAVARDEESGRFVTVTVQGGTAPLRRAPPRRQNAREDEEDEDDGTGLRLYNSFYETALSQNIPRTVIDELVRLFSNEVDFQRRASAEDSFEVFYAAEDENEIDLMYASITVGGQKYRYYRYVLEDGTADYYDETGRSARRFLLRKPLAGGQMRSGFGLRFHPILRYYRMHNGTDFVDKHGTPIVAAGHGRVISAGWDRGYGRRIEIEHGNGYVTSYSHLSAFARGIEEGARVRQGQVIGFMGSTGLSTGTHLHYEVIVNGVHQDPMRVRVPRGRQFNAKEMADFKRHREQVDALIARAPGNARIAAAPR